MGQGYLVFKAKNYTHISTSFMVQWLRLHAPNAEGLGLIPGRGTGSHVQQLRVQRLQQMVPYAAIKGQHSQLTTTVGKMPQKKWSSHHSKNA